MSTSFLIRCTDEEHALWKERAWHERLSLAAWVRKQLYVALEEPEEAPKPTKKKKEKPITTVVASRCVKRLEKGTWCKSCGRIH